MRVRRVRPGGERSCSSETEQGMVGRRVPLPSPGAGPGYPALCAPLYATTLLVQVRQRHRAGIMRGAPQHPLHAIPPHPPAMTPLSHFSLPPAVCLAVLHRVRRARPRRCPSGGRRSSATRAWGCREEKIMNEIDAVLPLPRPPGPGNLGVGAAPEGSPSGAAGWGAPEIRVGE